MPLVEQVENGGFESGRLDPEWTTKQGSPNVVTYASTAIDADDTPGDNGFLLTGGTATAEIEQTQTLNDGSGKAPAAATLWATYDDGVNAVGGKGDLTGTLVGGAEVSGGKLRLNGKGLGAYADYDADRNADTEDTGTVRIRLTPAYSGSPTTTTQVFWAMFEDEAITNNLVAIVHTTTGALRMSLRDKDNTVLNHDFATWSPMAGQTYEIELNFDFVAGEQRLFIDGKLHGEASVTMNRDAAIGPLRVGGSVTTGATQSDFDVDDIIIYNSVVHTAEHTPLGAVPNLAESGDDNIQYTVAVLLGGIGAEEQDTAEAIVRFRDVGDGLLPVVLSLGPVAAEAAELVKKTFNGKLPKDAVKAEFSILLTKGGAGANNQAAADCLSVQTQQDLVVFVDSYATVAELDELLYSNKRWRSLALEDKESYITQATRIIDNGLVVAGRPKATSQSLKFPRNFDTLQVVSTFGFNEFFSETTQLERLRMATLHQVEYLLDNTEFGVADSTNSQASLRRAGRRNTISPLAYEFLRDYTSRYGELREAN